MAKYPKPRRTQMRGLKPSSYPAQVPFSPKKIEEMGIKVLVALNKDDSNLSEPEIFILKQVSFVCGFREARENQQETNEFLRLINKGEEEGHRLGFSSEDLKSLNRWVLEQEQAGKFKELSQQVKRKIGEVGKGE